MPTPNDLNEIDQTLPPSGEPEIGTVPEGADPNEAGKRSAEARINELLSKNKQLEEKLVGIEARMAPPPPPTPAPKVDPENPELKRVMELVRDLGFVQKDDLKAEMQTLRDITALNNEHNRLEGSYDGSDGRPRYNRTEVEKFMRERGVYDPEIAYEQIHKGELLDYTIKQAEEKRRQPYVTKPNTTANAREDSTITREMIAEWMKTPEGRIKYERNRDKILSLMRNGQL